MTKLIYLFGLLLLSLTGYSQLSCDSLACEKYADTSSFEIIGYTELAEIPQDKPFMISCDLLCVVEEARSSVQDVTINYNGYKIVVFREEEK